VVGSSEHGNESSGAINYLGISWIVEQLIASQKELYPIGSVG
jgi:hypothetical protein